MVRTMGVVLLAVALVCCSTQAQSLLLEKGQYALYVQGGYVGAQNSTFSGAEFELGFSPCSGADIGVSVLTGTASHSYNYGYWSSSWEEKQTLFGPVINIYLLKVGGEGGGIAIGLHEAASFESGPGAKSSNSAGATLNLMTPRNPRGGFVISAGYFANSIEGISGINNSAMIGANPFLRTKSGTLIGLILQYNVNEGPDSYAIGLSIGLSRTRGKN